MLGLEGIIVVEEGMMRVFVVDDDPEVVDMLLWVLRQDGYEASGFTTAEEALRATQVDPPGVMLVDLMMPEITGDELCRMVKADVGTQDVAVIFLSGYGYLEREAVEAGADGYICKPFDLDDVTRKVAQILQPVMRVAGS